MAPTAIAARCEPTDKRKIDDIAATPMLAATRASVLMRMAPINVSPR